MLHAEVLIVRFPSPAHRSEIEPLKLPPCYCIAGSQSSKQACVAYFLPTVPEALLEWRSPPTAKATNRTTHRAQEDSLHRWIQQWRKEPAMTSQGYLLRLSALRIPLFAEAWAFLTLLLITLSTCRALRFSLRSIDTASPSFILFTKYHVEEIEHKEDREYAN